MNLEQSAYTDIHRPLIELCRKGDRKAQYELYKLYSKAMFNISMRITNDYAQAEDVLQESFLSAFSHIRTFKGEVTFGSWLKKIVINNAIGQIRKKKLELIFLDGHEEYFVEDSEKDEQEQQWQVETIRKAIQKLPDGYRIVLSLYLLEGYDHAEIGEILGISEATSKSQYSRARKKLLEIIRVDKLTSLV
jgi:RNA polymerase sigma factor (sigma-70 family)